MINNKNIIITEIVVSCTPDDVFSLTEAGWRIYASVN